MGFRSSDVLGIAADTLEFALSAAERSHPDEYLGLLRTTDASELGLEEDGRVLTDVLVIPGTVSNHESATLQTSLVPNDRRAAGSIHSHPSGVLRPSDADLGMFSKRPVNIIMGSPYEHDDWRAFDRDGEWHKLSVLDVSLPDPTDFFDFTQEDIDRELQE